MKFITITEGFYHSYLRAIEQSLDRTFTMDGLTGTNFRSHQPVIAILNNCELKYESMVIIEARIGVFPASRREHHETGNLIYPGLSLASSLVEQSHRCR